MCATFLVDIGSLITLHQTSILKIYDVWAIDINVMSDFLIFSLVAFLISAIAARLSHPLMKRSSDTYSAVFMQQYLERKKVKNESRQTSLGNI